MGEEVYKRRSSKTKNIMAQAYIDKEGNT